MEKITRLNWFKKVFGGVAALCAWPMLAKASKENPYLIVKAYTSLPKYHIVPRQVVTGWDLGDTPTMSSIRPFLNVIHEHVAQPNKRIMIPIWLEQIPENLSEFGLMERMIYGERLPNQTRSSWQKLETENFEQGRLLTYKANMVGLVTLLGSGDLPEGSGGEVVLHEIRQFGHRWVAVYADSEGAARDFGAQFMNYIKLLGVPSRTK